MGNFTLFGLRLHLTRTLHADIFPNFSETISLKLNVSSFKENHSVSVLHSKFDCQAVQLECRTEIFVKRRRSAVEELGICCFCVLRS